MKTYNDRQLTTNNLSDLRVPQTPRFLNWKVYKDSKSLVKEILEISSHFPQDRKLEIGSQIDRSAISIVLNIAEGCGKDSDKDLNRFLNISLGSIYETIAALDIARDVNLIKQERFENVLKKLLEIKRQLGGLKKKLNG